MPGLSNFFCASILGLASFTTASPAHPPQPKNRLTVYPDVAETSHATTGLVRFLRDYFTAKSRHDPETWLKSFKVPEALYIDATLGWYFDHTNFTAAVHNLTASW